MISQRSFTVLFLYKKYTPRSGTIPFPALSGWSVRSCMLWLYRHLLLYFLLAMSTPTTTASGLTPAVVLALTTAKQRCPRASNGRVITYIVERLGLAADRESVHQWLASYDQEHKAKLAPAPTPARTWELRLPSGTWTTDDITSIQARVEEDQELSVLAVHIADEVIVRFSSRQTSSTKAVLKMFEVCFTCSTLEPS